MHLIKIKITVSTLLPELALGYGDTSIIASPPSFHPSPALHSPSLPTHSKTSSTPLLSPSSPSSPYLPPRSSPKPLVPSPSDRVPPGRYSPGRDRRGLWSRACFYSGRWGRDRSRWSGSWRGGCRRRGCGWSCTWLWFWGVGFSGTVIMFWAV